MSNLALDLFGDNEEEITLVSKVDSWKSEVKGKLTGLIEALANYRSSRSCLSGYVTLEYDRLDSQSSIERVLNDWIKAKCSAASVEANNMGHLRIEADRIPGDIGRFSFSRNEKCFLGSPKLKKVSRSELTDKELVDYALELFDFEKFDWALNKVSDELEGEGFKVAAAALGREFGLTILHSHTDKSIKVKQQKGRYIVEISNYGWSNSERFRSLLSTLPVIKTFEAETGLHGLSDCFSAAAEEENNLGSYDHIVASRTKVNENENVEAVFFREKIKFHFKPELFEGLCGFIQSYSDKPLKNIEV